MRSARDVTDAAVPDAPSPRLPWLIAGLMLLAALPYVGVRFNGFTIDDTYVYSANACIRDLRNLPVLLDARYFAASSEASYRPICTLSYMLDYAIWGARAAGPHATGILLNVGAVLAVFGLAFTLLRRRWPAFFAAALFAVHPLHSEVVSALGFREDLLVGMLVPLALVAYARARSSGRHRWLAAAWSAYAVALLSKEGAIVLPVLAVLMDTLGPAPAAGERDRARRVRLPFYLGLAALTAGFVLVRFWLMKFPAEGTQPRLGGSLYGTFLADVHIQARNLLLLLWPHPLRAYYPPELYPARADLAFWLGLAALLACAAPLLVARRARLYAFCFLWWFACLGPVANVYPIYNPMAERYLYLASIGPAVGLAALAAHALRSRRAQVAGGMLAALLVALLAWRTAVRTTAWRDNVTLWSLEQRLSPNDPMVLANLASACFERQDYRATLDFAERAIGAAGKRPPDSPRFDTTPSWVIAGSARMMLGDANGALAAWLHAETGLPCRFDIDAALYRNLALAYDARGDTARSVDYLERAVRADAYDPQLWAKLAYGRLRLGQRDRARQAWDEARRREATLPAFNVLEADYARELKTP